MKDEIKEILDYLQENSKKDEATKQLVDYITNLQQENISLAKENEQEKQFIKDCGFENVQQLALDYIGIRHEKEDYKSRCEKALKLAESYELGKYDYSIPPGGIIELKDILNGRSDE